MAAPIPRPILCDEITPLENGDRLTRAEFERRYEAMPTLKKAELIEGAVFLTTAVNTSHGWAQAHLIGWLGYYHAFTRGIEAGAHCTVRLDWDNEPQPDAILLVDPARGGQTRVDGDDFVTGAPELVAEVASSRVSIDLNAKLNVYRRNGVREYVVWRVLNQQVDWFVLCEGQYEPLTPDEQGLLKSELFPGLWLDPAALIGGDLARVLALVQQGLASLEHAAFVARLNPPQTGP